MGQLQACHLCGIAFDYDFVPSNPFKVCPKCGAPLEEAAVASRFVEAGNPSDVNDAQRASNRAQLMEDVGKHQEAFSVAKAASKPATAAPTDVDPQ